MDTLPAPQPWVELTRHYPGGEGLACLIDGQPWPCQSEAEARVRKLDAVAELGRLGRDPSYLRGFEDGRTRGVATIVEAWNELARRFPGARLHLDVRHDPEGGHDELWLRVGVRMGVAELHAASDAFDEEWWLDRVPKAGFGVGFDFLADGPDSRGRVG